MTYAQMSEHLAGPIALLKQHITSTGRATAQDAVQVFGGRGITQSGMGKLVENVSAYCCYQVPHRGRSLTGSRSCSTTARRRTTLS